MRYLILIVLVFISSCSLNVSALGASTIVQSSVNFSVNATNGWIRLANIMRPQLPGYSYGDLTFYHEHSNTFVIISSVDNTASPPEILRMFQNMMSRKYPNALFTDISDAAEIKNTASISLKLEDRLIRVLAVDDGEYTHIIQCIIGSDESPALSEFLNTFRL